jgi:probable F420-dependent oxidoreductase
MARTVDHISEGRLIFGIGSGWFERDYTEYGYDFGTAGSRLDALGEALPRIEKRWSELNPAPVREIPVMIGGGGEKKTLKYVARHADIWHSFSDVDTLERKLGILADHCEAIGRDVSEIEVSTAADSAEAAKPLYDAGARLFTYGVGGPDYDLKPLEDLVAWRDSVG